MICLTSDEETVYNEQFVERVPSLEPGLYYIRDFFGDKPSVPRIARRFFEEVSNGRYSNIVLNKELSREGYLVLEKKPMNQMECKVHYISTKPN